MKFPLPGFRKSSPQAEVAEENGMWQPGPAADTSDVIVKPVSLSRIRLKMLGAAIVPMLLLALFVFQVMSVYISGAMEREVRLTVDQVAARTGALVKFYSSNMSLLARDPDIARLLMAGDPASLQEKEQSLTYLFPAAINVRLLPPEMEDVDLEASPPISYAALAQMREAESSENLPPAEVQLYNTPQQHVNIVRRVSDPAGSGTVGHLMLSLSGGTLDDLLDEVQHINGYMELQQSGARGAPVPVARAGDAAFRSGGPDAVQAIDGSRWQVAYWSGQSSMDFLGMVSLWVIGAAALLVILMVLYTLAQFRRLKAGLMQDQVSLVSLMKDARNKQLRRDYPAGLVEMQETLDFMTRLADVGVGVGVVAGNGAGAGAGAGADAGDGDGADAGAGKGHTQTVVIEHVQDAEYSSDMEKAESTAEEMLHDFEPVHADSLILEEDPLEIADEDDNFVPDRSIFRAYDIRGVVGQTLTAAAAKQIGRAIGSEAIQRGCNTVVVGRDGRLSGPELAEALIAGLNATGCDVKDIGVVPTPVLYFAAHYLDTQTGVVVTGSHNPPDYNGLKIVIDGETLSGDSIQQLYERIEEDNLISGQGSAENMNVVPDYIERIRSDVHVDRPLKVVVDCGNGVAGGVAPLLLRELGCEVSELFCEVDGNFPNHHPDPSKVDNLQDLISAVKGQGADVGLAFDGDGDRLGVVTAEGSIVWPDRVLMLFIADILERNPGGLIIYDVKSSRLLDGIIREHGGEPLMWKTGHSFIKEKIKESGALLAGEMSGHIFFRERWYGFDDGLYSAARLLEVLGKDARSATEVFAALPEGVSTPELNIAMQEGEPPKFMDRLLASAHFEDAQVSTIDGLRVEFSDGWGLVRASNTTPVLVLRFEADDKDGLSRIMDEFRRVIQQVDANLSLPF